MTPVPMEWRHPELEEGELLLGYFDDVSLASIARAGKNWKTARKGFQVFDLNNESVTREPGELRRWPVFVKFWELHANNIKPDGRFNVNLPKREASAA